MITEPKLDGVSLALRYELVQNNNTKSPKYKLVWAATRGDGSTGQDVTAVASSFVPSHLESIPENVFLDPLLLPTVLEIRGEVILPFSQFPSNARNMASGYLMRKQTTIAVDVNASTNETKKDPPKEQQEDTATNQPPPLTFFAYDIVRGGDSLERPSNSSSLDVETHFNGIHMRSILVDLGFKTPEPSTLTDIQMTSGDEIHLSSIQNMLDYHEKLRLHREKSDGTDKVDKSYFGDYEMDGCVHKVSEQHFRDLLGTSTRAPRWAVAHKFPAQAAVTKLLNIDIQVGRTGALTPVAILEPANIGGVQVTRATLHNFEHALETFGRDSVRVGSSVLVQRAGDVIPKIARLVSEPREGKELSLSAPDKCPACGSATSYDRDEDESERGTIVRCSGPFLECHPRAVALLDHAFSRDALNIIGLSAAKIKQLSELGYLKKPSDLFDLASSETKMEELKKLDMWGEKSVANLSETARRISKDGVTLTRFIYSLGIRHLGLHSSRLIAAVYKSSKEFIRDLRQCHEGISDFDRLQYDSLETKGIGPVLIKSLIEFARDDANIRAVEKLAEVVQVMDETAAREEVDTGLPFHGLTVVLTGSVAGMTRSKLKQAVLDLGAKTVSSSVSKNTGVVVAGTKAGKKLEEARKLGIRIMDGEEFLELVNKK